VLHDPGFYMLRDAVEFPDGSRRTHTRSVNRLGHGAAASRCWPGESYCAPLPARGAPLAARDTARCDRAWRSLRGTARAEIHEEIGGRIGQIVPLVSSMAPRPQRERRAPISANGIGRQAELSEGIGAIEEYSVGEFENLLAPAQISDSFTVAAYTHARLPRTDLNARQCRCALAGNPCRRPHALAQPDLGFQRAP